MAYTEDMQASQREVEIPTTGYGGMGYNLPANPAAMGTPATGQGNGAPDWMSGFFDAPWWGQQAPNIGAAMLQEQGWGPYGDQGGAAAEEEEQGFLGPSFEDWYDVFGDRYQTTPSLGTFERKMMTGSGMGANVGNGMRDQSAGAMDYHKLYGQSRPGDRDYENAWLQYLTPGM